MRTFIISIMALTTVGLSAQTNEAEDAIIMNQEMEFLQDSVSRVQAQAARPKTPEANRQKAINERSLERTFFGEEETDEVSTRTASPKRRGI